MFNTYPTLTDVSVTDHALAEAKAVVTAVHERTGVELTTEELLDSPHIFIGTIDELEAKLLRTRERLGISSFMVGAMGPLDPLVERLAGR